MISCFSRGPRGDVEILYRVIWGMYWEHIGIMEKKMEATI